MLKYSPYMPFLLRLKNLLVSLFCFLPYRALCVVVCLSVYQSVFNLMKLYTSRAWSPGPDMCHMHLLDKAFENLDSSTPFHRPPPTSSAPPTHRTLVLCIYRVTVSLWFYSADNAMFALLLGFRPQSIGK